MVTAIIAAAGQGKRMNRGINKVFIPLFQCPVLVHTLSAINKCEQVQRIIIVVGKDEISQVKELLQKIPDLKPLQIIPGGTERQYSISNALKHIPRQNHIVLIHDGARPMIEVSKINEIIVAAQKFGAAGLAVPVKDTIKVVDADGFIVSTPDRKMMWAIQTPQAFSSKLLQQAYMQAEQDGYLGTDDASLVERIGVKVKIIQGSYNNLKITTPGDIIIAEALLNGGAKKMMRIGMGYDVHKLVIDRKLILGGVHIPYEYGLEGHSDADVLLHAIKDALLGAAGLGDIGRHFPDSDETLTGISSLFLLEKVKEILDQARFKVNNIDATIVAQQPKVAGYIEQMNHNIARTLNIEYSKVNIKATTTEGLGFAGRREGIASYAVATIIEF